MFTLQLLDCVFSFGLVLGVGCLRHISPYHRPVHALLPAHLRGQPGRLSLLDPSLRAHRGAHLRHPPRQHLADRAVDCRSLHSRVSRAARPAAQRPVRDQSHHTDLCGDGVLAGVLHAEILRIRDQVRLLN